MVRWCCFRCASTMRCSRRRKLGQPSCAPTATSATSAPERDHDAYQRTLERLLRDLRVDAADAASPAGQQP